MNSPRVLIPLSEHCWRLAHVVRELWDHDPVTLRVNGEDYEFEDAAAWLHMASSVTNVEADTARFDDSIMWCGNAAVFEDARSVLYARLATEVTIFLFIWGGFETVTKLIDPVAIPRETRDRGANGMVDRVLYLLRGFTPLPAYDEALRELVSAMAANPGIAGASALDYPKHAGPSGHGLHLVRRIRNRFAHGSSGLPIPDMTDAGWCGNASAVPRIVSLSSRIVLLTMQMLLSTHYARHNFGLRALSDYDDDPEATADVHAVLSCLHYRCSPDPLLPSSHASNAASDTGS